MSLTDTYDHVEEIISPLLEEGLSFSNDAAQLFEALAAAQLDFQPIKKSVRNPAYNSWYADLEAVIAATRPALAKNGLVIVQAPSCNTDGKKLTLTSRMGHASGQWMQNKLTLPATMRDKFDAQSVGSAMTYARRYAWQCLTGTAAEMDDDANAASGQGSKEAPQASAAQTIADLKQKMANPPKGSVGEAQLASKMPAVGPALPLGAKAPEAGEERVQGLIRAVERLKTRTSPPKEYRRVDMMLSDDSEASFVCFANHVYPDKSTLFGLLDLIQASILETKRPSIASFVVVRDDKGSKIIRPLQLGPSLSFDDAGFPEIDNASR